MISNGCLAIVYFVDFVEIIWCVKMTSKANPPEIVRKSSVAGQIFPQLEHCCRFQNNYVCPDQQKNRVKLPQPGQPAKKKPVCGRYQASRSRH
jgi:hypothetical protein